MIDQRGCDVAVIGGGPAGLSAAWVAAGAGADVVVVDSQQRPGGQYFRQPAVGRERHATAIQDHGRALADRALTAGARILQRTSVWNVSAGLNLELLEPAGISNLAAKAVIVATGAYERTAAFPGWTLPGVYTAGGIQSLLKEHGVIPGRKVLLAGVGPLQLVVAASLVRAGVRLAGIYEAARPVRHALARPISTTRGVWGHWDKLAEGASSLATLRADRVKLRTGWGIVRAHGTSEVIGANVARLDDTWRPIPGSEMEVECDTIAIHHGLMPALGVLDLFGAETEWQPSWGGHVPVIYDAMATSVAGVFAAGDGTGIGGVGLSMIEGEIAGAASAAYALHRSVDIPRAQLRRLARHRRFRDLYGTMFAPGPGLNDLPDKDTLLCRCENVSSDDFLEAIGRGALTLGTVKSLTRCGMGNCQGRVCEPIITAALAHRLDIAPDVVGRYRTRSPLTPIPVGEMTAEAKP